MNKMMFIKVWKALEEFKSRTGIEANTVYLDHVRFTILKGESKINNNTINVVINGIDTDIYVYEIRSESAIRYIGVGYKGDTNHG